MQVCVIGAGVAGLTTAYYLAQQGCSVTVVDAAEEVASGASGDNGGQLSYSYVEPLAGPATLRKLPSLLFGKAPALRLQPTFDARQWAWCIRFLRYCTERSARATTAALLELSFLSRDLLQQMIVEHPMSFDFARRGKLVLYYDESSWDEAKRQLEFQRTLGCEQQALDANACFVREPALVRSGGELIGGIFTPGEYAGDCAAFCRALYAVLRQAPYGVRFRLGTKVSKLIRRHKGIAVATSGGDFEPDAAVLAAGTDSAALAAQVNLVLPIYPLKGYSITANIDRHHYAPQTSVTDTRYKMVFTRLGKRLRVSGMVELTGFDQSVKSARIATLKAATRALFGDCADLEGAREWAGLRPTTPNGRPLLGKTSIPGLFVNTGHGMLGFTLACGTAKVVADELVGCLSPTWNRVAFAAD